MCGVFLCDIHRSNMERYEKGITYLYTKNTAGMWMEQQIQINENIGKRGMKVLKFSICKKKQWHLNLAQISGGIQGICYLANERAWVN